ncbi:MAG: helix-turn-helix domain-containing protein [Treponema sp.]|jgi:putative transcriptional regulator|nr:helix-turn-helix domain-containing protein [Treponema sp.]
MSKQFESIMEGLNELSDYSRGDKTKTRVRVIEVPDISIAPLNTYDKDTIKQIRLGSNLTLKSFASCMGVSQKTVESWESGTNTPSGASCRLLQILEKKPDALRELEIINIPRGKKCRSPSAFTYYPMNGSG